MSSLEKSQFSSPAHFLFVLFGFFMLSCMNCFYILEINPLPVALVTSIFFKSIGCSFVLFMVSFAVQKLLSSIKSYLFVLVISITLGDRFIKILLQFMPKSFLPMFFSKNFMVSSLTLRALIHFEFIFIY